MIQAIAQMQIDARKSSIHEEIEVLKARRMDQAIQMGMGMLPTIVANALPQSNVGVAIAKHGKDGVRMSVQQLMNSLEPDQLLKIAQHLSQDQVALFMAIANAANEDNKKDEQARPQSMREREYTDEEIAAAKERAEEARH